MGVKDGIVCTVAWVSGQPATPFEEEKPTPCKDPPVRPPRSPVRDAHAGRTTRTLRARTLPFAPALAWGLLGTAIAPLHAGAQDRPDLTGTWEGQVTTSLGQDIRIVFHIEAADAGWSATWDSPDQGAVGLPAGDVSVSGSGVSIDLPVIQGGYDGDLQTNGDEIRGTFRQGPAEIPLVLTRTAREAATLERPQEPRPPYPYRSTDVEFVNADGGGHTMAGTLTLPEGTGPFPAAVLISGSGPQDRDETLQGHKPFLVLADHLTRSGIAVLRYDDRGVGGSGGAFATATSEDFATDAAAAVRFLRERSDIDPAGIGLIGHSEGGLIAPIVATERDGVAFLVLLAGPGVPGDRVLLSQGALIARAGGASEADIRHSQDLQRRLFAAIRAGGSDDALQQEVQRLLEEGAATLTPRQRESAGLTEAGIRQQAAQITTPWFRFFLRHDPAMPLARVTQPVLAINGEKDLQVPSRENLRAIRAALESGGNGDITTRELRGLNHLFQTAVTGAPSEYGAITETFSPDALSVVSSWILERFGG